ncbi:unnamed protein product [Brassicogethes aeneus]|uniref:Hepatocyte growth factor-regulated tyrosine kinase substrate n=1 Tax=Brassicogethes aeneus TaxID=1431903 RepID=A0A9P0BID0_BRAAE|nr:unnamed protein product [Brassicogethes aeneus]
MFRGSAFDRLMDKATSHLLMEADWVTIMQICDLIRQNDVQPKTAFSSIKKKLTSENPYTALYALIVLESMVKNCGSAVHEELTTKINCDFLYDLIRITPHSNVKAKLLELIQAWNFALRKNSKHGHLKDLLGNLKSEGHKFPALRESDAMFAADSAPEWAEGDSCHRCRVQFTLITRKHHCRNCGQVFCHNCSQKEIPLPKFGIEKEVRVCDTCYDQLTRPQQPGAQKENKEELPAVYLKSSLAQQKQEPPRKSEEELREEEELQLALALSQSEAEAKEKEKIKMTSTLHGAYNAKPEAKPAERSPSPPDEQANPELARYLNRSYWESLNDSSAESNGQRAASPTAPAQNNHHDNHQKAAQMKENGLVDHDLEEFIRTLKSQVEIFINRMKSNSSRGRSIANDTSVQTLFMNITAMHSRLLRHIQSHDDSRMHYERLQDKLTRVKEAREALDALRDEHRDKMRREAEEAERQRQLQMAHKLDIMRKKKQEYLQYQRRLALQRIQEQEREMHMRQEQQKQQYLNQYAVGPYMGSPVHNQQQYPVGPQGMPPVGVNYYQGYQPQMLPNVPQGQPHPGMQQHAPVPLPSQPMPNMAHPQNFQGAQPPPPGQFMAPPGGVPPQNVAGGGNPPPPPPQQQFSPPAQQQDGGKQEDAKTGELISFD